MKSFRVLSPRAVLFVLSFLVATGSAWAGDVWRLVTDAASLAVDDVVIIAAKDSDFALSTTQNTNNRGQAPITKDTAAGTCTFGSDVQELTLKAGTLPGTFAFYTGSGYLYAAHNSSNYLKTKSTLDDNGSWLIQFGLGECSIVAQGSNAINVLRHNSSNKIFSCYAAGKQKALVLYRKESDGTPEVPPFVLSVEPETVTLTLGEEVRARLDASRNFTDLTVSPTVGTLSGMEYRWTPDAPGTYTITFSAVELLELTTGTATLTVIVNSDVAPLAAPLLYEVNTATLRNDGTGFDATWEAIASAASYELQVATNALFETVSVPLAAEDFATAGANTYPEGWTGSAPSDIAYVSQSSSAITVPTFKFRLANQTLTSPTFAEGIRFVSFKAKPAPSSDGETITLTGTGANGPVSKTVTLPSSTTTREYLVDLEDFVPAVTLTYSKLAKNCALDDITLASCYDSIVRTLTTSDDDPVPTSIALTDLTPNTDYFLRVRALDPYGIPSDWSRTISITTPAGITPFPPELNVLSTGTAVTGAQAVGFALEYSDANGDPLTLSLAVNGADPEPLSLSSGSFYTFIPTTAGLNTLVFSVTDGTFTTSVTKTVDVALAAPALFLSDLTLSPLGFTSAWYPISLAETLELEVASDPAFDTASGVVCLSEDFTTLTKTAPPFGWEASSDGSGDTNGLQFSGKNTIGERAPAFRFANDNETLASPTFAPARYLTFHASATDAGSSLYIEGIQHGEIVETLNIAVAAGRNTYSHEFGLPLTQLRFTFIKNGGNIGLDDVVITDNASRDTRIATRTVAADASPLVLTDLTPATTWYVRARAVSGDIASEWSATRAFEMMPAPTTIRLAYGKYVESGITASWDPVPVADAYRVSVSESRILPDTLILAEDFTNGKNCPGWEFFEMGTYTTTGSSGESAGSLKFDTEGESIAVTPFFDFPADSVSFWARCPSTEAGCELTIKALVDLSWVTVGSVWPTYPTSEDHSYTLDLPAGTRSVLFALTKRTPGSNLALDDVVIRGAAPVYSAPVTYTTTDTSLALHGLHGNTHIAVTVSSLYGDLEAISEPVYSKTPGYNPGTLIRIQ